MPEELEEQLNETAAAISEELMFCDYWKYALIFGALEPDVYQIYFPINENIRARLPLSAEDSIAVADIFKDEIDNLSLSEDSSAADVASAINIALGCFYMGIEMAIGYPDEDGDWQEVGDSAAINQWVTGFGNPFEYDNPVSEVVAELLNSEAPDIRDCFYETFKPLVTALYDIDFEEHEDDFGSTDWESVAEAFDGLL